MKSSWNDATAQEFEGDLLQLRVYTSRLLGQEEDLVLHGGGNTSVKIKQTNIFGEEEEILYVKGSGWNLGTIEAAGFAPVRLSDLHKAGRARKPFRYRYGALSAHGYGRPFCSKSLGRDHFTRPHSLQPS